MKAFEYVSTASADIAVKALGGVDGAILAGGTDLLSRMKDYVTTPKRVVDFNPQSVVQKETSPGGVPTWTILAGTTLADLLASKALREELPALWQAASEVGTPQIKNMATIAGNLLQRPRCWYYRSGFGLLSVKDGKNLLREGDNRYASIFHTDGDALFVAPSSLAVPLIALGASATILGPKGERTVMVSSLYQIPKRDSDRELTIGADEVLTKITLPAPQGKNATYEARQKQSHDWPLVLASVSLRFDGASVSQASIVIGGVAPIPYRAVEAEKAMFGKPVTLETAEAVAANAINGVKPLSGNVYKVALTKTVVKRALLAAVGNRYWEEV